VISDGATPSLVTSNCTGERDWGGRLTTRSGPLGSSSEPSAANTLICIRGDPFTPITSL
jgi:hypothetical protein